MKMTISLSVTLTAFLGYCMYSGNVSFEVLPLIAGVFLLSSGSSAVNQFQEINTDQVMSRTRNRPLPAGRLSPLAALSFAFLLLFTGSLILYACYPPGSLILALIAFAWYNFLYTPLKKITAFAVFPGSVIGGIPPLIGWTAAGGHLGDPVIWMVFLFLFIGQIPHFWLLLLMHGKDYEKAGLPSLTNLLEDIRIRQLAFFWISATAMASLVFVVKGLITNGWLIILLSAGAMLLVLSSLSLPFSRKSSLHLKSGFIRLNAFYLYVILILLIQHLFYQVTK
jgi:heme o synthase